MLVCRACQQTIENDQVYYADRDSVWCGPECFSGSGEHAAYIIDNSDRSVLSCAQCQEIPAPGSVTINLECQGFVYNLCSDICVAKFAVGRLSKFRYSL